MQEPLTLFIIVAIIVLIATAVKKLLSVKAQPIAIKPRYKYRRKDYIMTRNEASLFRLLDERVGHKFYIFSQVHLNDLLDHKIKGQDWRAALSYIQRKSVDFVLVDRQTLVTKIAVELDDSTHEVAQRASRDDLVNAILEDAGIQLIRSRSYDEIINQIVVDPVDVLGVDIEDTLYEDVRVYVASLKTVSTANLQRRFRIGYARASRMLDRLEEDGIISQREADNGARKVL